MAAATTGDGDVVALRLAPWLARTMCEMDDSRASASKEDAKALFVGLFEPVARAFVVADSPGTPTGRKRKFATADAIADALVRLLRTASDHALYSSLDADGAVETRVASFVASATSRNGGRAPDGAARLVGRHRRRRRVRFQTDRAPRSRRVPRDALDRAR